MEQSKCPSTGKWINELWSIHTAVILLKDTKEETITVINNLKLIILKEARFRRLYSVFTCPSGTSNPSEIEISSADVSGWVWRSVDHKVTEEFDGMKLI